MTAVLPADISESGNYNKSQTARLLGIGRSTLDDHIKQGHIRIIKHRYSKRVSIKGREIIRFFNAIS